MATKTGNNKATNNYIVRLWSKAHYGQTKSNEMSGTITEVKSKEIKHFHSAGGFLKAMELLDKKTEKAKRKKGE